MRNGSYLAIISRIDYLRSGAVININDYMRDFEISERTAKRDFDMMYDLGWERYYIQKCGRNVRSEFRWVRV